MIKVSKNQRGLTLIEFMIVVFIIGLLAALAISNFLKLRTETHKRLCINNLRIIDGAKEQWALISRGVQGQVVDENEVDQFVKNGAPDCPAGGLYAYGVLGATPTCTLAREEGHFLSRTRQQQCASEDSPEDEERNKEIRDRKAGRGKEIGAARGKGKEKGGREPA